ncbi:MAG: DUF4342 domain-containing protein [Firmicutes bacterium]|nr:DUF4342 domain-containing protein [Bacillota bacterium]
MEITLEKIELVKDRTGSTYAEAKAALEAADGSVVDAIIAIEESINSDFDDASGIKDSKLVEMVKEMVAKGNMARIIIRKAEETVLNLPLTAGVVGAVLVPWGAIIGAIAAVGLGCVIEFVNDKGEVVDINGKVVGIYDKAKYASKKAVDEFTAEGGPADKVSEWVYKNSDKIESARAKSTEKVSEFVDKGIELSNIAKEKFDELNLKEKLENLKTDDLKAQAEKLFKKDAEVAEDEDKEIQFGEHINIDVEDIEEAEGTEE